MYLVVDFIIPSIFFLCQYVPELLHVFHNETTELYSTSSLCPSFKTVVTKTPNITFNHGVSGVQNITSILDVTKGPSFSATRTDTVQVQYTMTTHGPNFPRDFKTVTHVTGTKDKTTTKTPSLFSTRGVSEGPSTSTKHTATEVPYKTTTHGPNFPRNFKNVTYVTGTKDKTTTKTRGISEEPSISTKHTATEVQNTTTHGPNFPRNFRTVTHVTGTKDKTTTQTSTMFSTRGVTQVPNFSALNSATEVQNIQPTHGSHFERNKHSVRVINTHVKNPNGAQNVFSTRGISEGPSTSTKHTATELHNTTTTYGRNFRRNFKIPRFVTRKADTAASEMSNMFSTRGISEGPSTSTKHTDTEVQYTTTHVPNFRRNFKIPRYVTRKADTAASEVSNMFSTRGISEGPSTSTKHIDTEVQYTTTTHGRSFRRNFKSPRYVTGKADTAASELSNMFSTRGISEGPSTSTKYTATEVQYTTTTHSPIFRRKFRTPRYVTGKADTAASEVSNMFPTYGVAEAAKKPTYQMDTPIDRTAAIEANMKAIRDDLCNKESKKDGNESKRKTNRDYLIHILTDFTFSNKTSEQEWKKLFVRPLVAHLCKPKKWKLFGKLVVRLDEFNGNGDGKIDENEKNRIHSEMKTWTENGWKRKRKGKKDRKRKLRHQ